MTSQPANAPLPTNPPGEKPNNETPMKNGQPSSPHLDPLTKNNSLASLRPGHSKKPVKSTRRLLFRLFGLFVVLGIGAGLFIFVGTSTGLIRPFGQSSRLDLIVHKVQVERLQLTITERGQL